MPNKKPHYRGKLWAVGEKTLRERKHPAGRYWLSINGYSLGKPVMPRHSGSEEMAPRDTKGGR